MTSYMDLKPDQLDFFKHGGYLPKKASGTIALIMRDGTIVMDYPSEVLNFFEEVREKDAKREAKKTMRIMIHLPMSEAKT